jgi:uncharacterized hydrophobic protein (TIGR00341 family)
MNQGIGMALRLIEMIVPGSRENEALKILKSQSVVSTWSDVLTEDRVLVKALIRSGKTEAILDLLEKRFANLEDFRVILLPVEASIPRPESAEPGAGVPVARAGPPSVGRRYREEVYADVVDAIKLTRLFIALCVMSSMVAAIGVLKGNVPAIIGAMVIAPLLGPNVALSFSTTLGDMNLARRALKAGALGILAALLVPVVIGAIFSADVSPDLPEIEPRTTVDMSDVVIALVAGTAGGLAFTTGVSTALVGVMVAVALLPPLAVFGLLIGAGHFAAASGSLLLLLANVICVNLAGVVTFIVQGIQPTTWWEATKARRATRLAVLLWVILLAILVAVIVLSQV